MRAAGRAVGGSVGVGAVLGANFSAVARFRAFGGAVNRAVRFRAIVGENLACERD